MAITQTTADVTGTINNQMGGDIHLVYDVIDRGGNINDWPNDINLGALVDGAFTREISPLFSNTTYFVRVYTVLDDGSVQFTQPESFTTLVSTIPAPPTAGLLLWTAVDEGITTADGVTIDQWDDKSGNANHLTRPVGNVANGPFLRTDILGDQFIEVDGNAPELTIPNSLIVNNRNCTVVYIGSRSANISGGGYANQAAYMGIGFVDPAIGFTVPNLVLFGGGTKTTNLNDHNITSMLGMISSASESRIFQNGRNEATTPQINSNLTATGGIVFKHPSSANLEPVGTCLGIFIYDHPLTAQEYSDLQAHVTAKYRGVGSSNDTQIAFNGDSLTAGAQVDHGHSWPLQLGRLRNHDFDGLNAGVGSSTILDINADAVSWIDPAYNATEYSNSIVCVLAGTRDLVNGGLAAAVIADLQTLAAARKAVGWTTLIGTIYDRGDFSSSEENERVTVNQAIRDNVGNWHDGVIDYAGDSRLEDPSDTTYFNADALHLSRRGYQVMAEIASPVITSVLP